MKLSLSLSLSQRGWARLVAAAMGVIAFAVVLAAQRDQGLARDELVYMRHGTRYAQWWGDFLTGVDGTASAETITEHFGGASPTANNREHPPLMKTLFGASERLFHARWGWTSRTTAYRLPSAAVYGLLVALVVLFGTSLWGLTEGVIAGALTLFLPRTLFHAGLAAFDAPMVALWVAVCAAYYRALARPRWAIAVAVLYGCALATKHNALMLPAALIPHYLWVAWRSGQWWSRRLWVLAALVVGGPLVLIGLWPWLWFDTVAHVKDWLSFHLQHVHYNYEYLGDNWNAPPFPWHIPIVTTVLVVPVVTLVAGVMGFAVLADHARRRELRDRAPLLLLFLAIGVAIGPFLLTSTPIFGAEKHWATSFPLIALLAGYGVAWAARRAARAVVGADRRGTLAIVVAVGALVAGAAAAETAVAQPYALSYYNALAGGPAGGADLGMNRQFWGYAARGVLPWLADQPPGPVYSHDASPAWGTYLKEDRLPPGFRDAGHEAAGIATSKYALVIHELHFNRHDYLIWKIYGHVQPAFVLRYRGVPIVSVYRR